MKKEFLVILVMLGLLITLIFLNLALLHHSDKIMKQNRELERRNTELMKDSQERYILLEDENLDLKQAIQSKDEYIKQIEAHEAPYGE